MSDFGEWLKSQKDNGDSGLKALQDLAAQNPNKWQAASLAGYVAIADTAPDAARGLALARLGQYHERWLQQGKSTGMSIGQIVLVLGGLILAGCIFFGLSPNFIGSMSEIDQARGLITLLFALGTIGIAIITSVSVLWMDVSEIETRIAKAKDLLAILMGVLGTIVGFYFGTATGTTAKVAVGEVAVLPASTTPGKSVAVSARVKGGSGPYRYDIVVTDPNKATRADLSVLGKVSATGEITDQLPALPKDALGDFDVRVSVVDSNGVQGTGKSVTFKVTAPSAPPAADAGKPGTVAKQPSPPKPDGEVAVPPAPAPVPVPAPTATDAAK